MNRDEVFEKIVEICKDVFEDDALVITETTTADDVENWDSLSHLSLINEIEGALNIEFTLDEASKSKNIGELLDAAMRHLG